MSSVQFNKNKYVFSNKSVKKEIDEKLLEKQVHFYIKELKVYKITISKLISKYPSIEDRNLILNISYNIIEDEIILSKLKKRRELPVSDILKNTNIDRKFIEQWSHYIIAYAVLLYTEKYIDIYNYLNINFRELEILSVVRPSNEDLLFYKGIVIDINKKSSVILTNHGEFIRINNTTDKVGKEISGKEKKSLNYYRNIIAIAILAIVILGSGAYYKYQVESSMIIVQGTSKVKFKINKYGITTFVQSPTEKGKKLLREVNLKNKNIDNTLVELFKEFQNREMIPDNRKIDIIITGERFSSNHLVKVESYVKELKNNGDYTDDIQIIINNGGYEKVIK